MIAVADASKFARTVLAFVAPVADFSAIITADAPDDDLAAGPTVQPA